MVAMTELREIERLIDQPAKDLFSRADSARREWCGDEVHVRGIIEFSNVCSRDCSYCGLRAGNSAVRRYTMKSEEVLEVASQASSAGVRTMVLQSGESDSANPRQLAETIAEIKSDLGVAITLCVGQKPASDYRLWRERDADRYLLKHETASPLLYDELHPDSRLDARLSALSCLRALGYQVGSGCIIGLPGQTSLDLAADILLCSDLDVDMAAFGPFVPHAQTPLAEAPACDLTLALRVVAAARLVLGPVHIPATTAFDAIAPNGREQALRCGANVIMADLTPAPYGHLYDIYPRRGVVNSLETVLDILSRVGRPLALSNGDSLKARPRTGALASNERPKA